MKFAFPISAVLLVASFVGIYVCSLKRELAAQSVADYLMLQYRRVFEDLGRPRPMLRGFGLYGLLKNQEYLALKDPTLRILGEQARKTQSWSVRGMAVCSVVIVLCFIAMAVFGYQSTHG